MVDEKVTTGSVKASAVAALMGAAHERQPAPLAPVAAYVTLAEALRTAGTCGAY